MNVSAVLVTRGDVLLGEIIDSITVSGIEDVIVWDNSGNRDLLPGAIRVSEIGADMAVYGRYRAIHYARHPLIFVQDDDVVLPPESIQALIDRWEELAEDGVTDVLVANMPQRFRMHYTDSCLVGFGAVFPRDLPARAFERWYAAKKKPEGMNGEWGWIKKTADVIFTGLSPRVILDLPYTELPWAHAPNRMWKQPDHVAERQRMLGVVRHVRDA